jgi:DNA-binding beta-propeller fold protein YncE
MLKKIFWGSLILLFSVSFSAAQIPSPALLVLEKNDKSLAIIDTVTLKPVGRIPAGEDPHEVVASADGKYAYISNYGAFQSPQHTISVADLSAQKALPAIDLGS